jgi:hypothetical protein
LLNSQSTNSVEPEPSFNILASEPAYAFNIRLPSGKKEKSSVVRNYYYTEMLITCLLRAEESVRGCFEIYARVNLSYQSACVLIPKVCCALSTSSLTIDTSTVGLYN